MRGAGSCLKGVDTEAAARRDCTGQRMSPDRAVWHMGRTRAFVCGGVDLFSCISLALFREIEQGLGSLPPCSGA